MWSFFVYKMRLDFNVSDTSIHLRGSCVFKCSFWPSSAYADQCYVSTQDSTAMISRCLRSTCLCQGKASPFPLCAQCVRVYSTLLCTSSPDTSLHFDSLPNEGLQQQRPTLLDQEIDELLLNPWGGYVFPSSCQEVERSQDDSSPLNGSDFRSIPPFRLMGEAKHSLLCIIFSVQSLLSFGAVK